MRKDLSLFIQSLFVIRRHGEFRIYYVYFPNNSGVKHLFLRVIFLLSHCFFFLSLAGCLWRSSWLLWLPTRSKLVCRRWVSVATLPPRAGTPEARATPARPLPTSLVGRVSCLAGTHHSVSVCVPTCEGLSSLQAMTADAAITRFSWTTGNNNSLSILSYLIKRNRIDKFLFSEAFRLWIGLLKWRIGLTQAPSYTERRGQKFLLWLAFQPAASVF